MKAKCPNCGKVRELLVKPKYKTCKKCRGPVKRMSRRQLAGWPF